MLLTTALTQRMQQSSKSTLYEANGNTFEADLYPQSRVNSNSTTTHEPDDSKAKKKRKSSLDVSHRKPVTKMKQTTIRRQKRSLAKPSDTATYAEMVKEAIENAGGQAYLSQIYDYLEHKFGCFVKTSDHSWKNSVRHNLSIHPQFKRISAKSIAGKTHSNRSKSSGKAKGSAGLWIVCPVETDESAHEVTSLRKPSRKSIASVAPAIERHCTRPNPSRTISSQHVTVATLSTDAGRPMLTDSYCSSSASSSGSFSSSTSPGTSSLPSVRTSPSTTYTAETTRGEYVVGCCDDGMDVHHSRLPLIPRDHLKLESRNTATDLVPSSQMGQFSSIYMQPLPSKSLMTLKADPRETNTHTPIKNLDETVIIQQPPTPLKPIPRNEQYVNLMQVSRCINDMPNRKNTQENHDPPSANENSSVSQSQKHVGQPRAHVESIVPSSLMIASALLQLAAGSH